LGRRNQWCTAAKNNNMFNYYHRKGNLYYFIPKFSNHEDEKYASAMGDSCARNEKDEEVSRQWLMTK
jgi:hypothetical protein